MSKARLLLAVSLVVLTPTLVWAQGGQNGSIIGYVFDEAGMPLKGIKVSASSATQIGGSKAGYTTDEGSFRIPQLQPGTFEVRASAPKLETIIMKGVKVGIGAPSEINIVMKVQTATEEVAVVEKAPLVVTTKAAMKETFELDMVEALPHGSRDNIHNQMVNDVAGGMNNRVRGGTTTQTIFSQDGFEMRGQFPTLKSSAAYEVNTGGFGVDNPMASGGSINLVTKSGSNKFEFEFNATADSNRLRFFRDEQDSPAATYFYVINPMISGPIIKDRLWYMFNTESHIIQNGRDPDVEGYFAQPTAYRKFIQKGTLKLTWQVTGRNKLQTLTNFDSPHEYNMIDGVGIQPEAQQTRHGFRLMQGLIWESLLSDAIVFRSQVGFIMIPEHIYPAICDTDPTNCDFIPAFVNKFPRTQRYGNDSSNPTQRKDIYSVQFQNRLEWFASSKALGEHAFQLKDNFYTETNIIRSSRPGDRLYELQGANSPEALTTYYSNDPRVEPARYGWFIATSNASRHIATLSDAWRPTRYLTFTPAISHVWAYGSNSSGATNNTILGGPGAFAPAISAAWDATHDGRTVLRASYNQYVDLNIFDIARHTLGSQVQRRCKWNDTSNDGNAINDANYNKECEFSGGAGSNTIGLPCGPTGIGLDGLPCRSKLVIPRTFEYTIGGERELVEGVAMSLDFVYKNFANQYEVRETNRVWNSAGTALATTGAYRNGRSQVVNDLETPDGANRQYKGMTVGVNKREGRVKIHASYTLSSLVGTVFEGINNPWGDIAPRDVYLRGPLADDHRHEIKMSATYQATPWLSGGIRYRYYSGTPYSRLYYNNVTGSYDLYHATVGNSPGTNLNDPLDDRTLRLPDQQDFNTQVRVNLYPLIGERLDLYVDILNVLGLRTTTAVAQEDNRFGVITTRMDPFRIRLGVNYRY